MGLTRLFYFSREIISSQHQLPSVPGIGDLSSNQALFASRHFYACPYHASVNWGQQFLAIWGTILGNDFQALEYFQQDIL